MDSSFLFDILNFEWSNVYMECHRLYISNKVAFLSQKPVFVLTHRVEPDEKPHYAAFYLCLHCLPKYESRSHSYNKG